MKKTANTVPTAKQYNAALQAYADAHLAETTANAKKAAEQKKLDERYADTLKDAADAKAKAYDTIKAYAETTRENLFGEMQSIDTIAGKLTFRKTPDAVVYEGDEQKIVEKLLQKGWKTLVTIKRSLNKAAIKKALTDGTPEAKDLKKLEVSLQSGETFEIKPA